MDQQLKFPHNDYKEGTSTLEKTMNLADNA